MLSLNTHLEIYEKLCCENREKIHIWIKYIKDIKMVGDGEKFHGYTLRFVVCMISVSNSVMDMYVLSYCVGSLNRCLIKFLREISYHRIYL